MGWFILYALLVSIPASLIGGWLFGEKLLKKHSPSSVQTGPEQDKAILATIEADMPKEHPSVATAFSLILLPIVLILVATVLPSLIPLDAVSNICAPVSYTHLDVYKRQHWKWSAMRTET